MISCIYIGHWGDDVTSQYHTVSQPRMYKYSSRYRTGQPWSGEKEAKQRRQKSCLPIWKNYSSISSFQWMQTNCQAAANSTTKPTDLGCESICRLPSSTPTVAIYYYYSARRLIIIYRPTEGRRLSWLKWLVVVTDQDVLPACRWSPILVLTVPDIEHLRSSRQMRYR